MLDGARVVETGSHEALMAKGGQYPSSTASRRRHTASGPLRALASSVRRGRLRGLTIRSQLERSSCVLIPTAWKLLGAGALWVVGGWVIKLVRTRWPLPESPSVRCHSGHVRRGQRGGPAPGTPLHCCPRRPRDRDHLVRGAAGGRRSRRSARHGQDCWPTLRPASSSWCSDRSRSAT